jgi:hypothetical protein
MHATQGQAVPGNWNVKRGLIRSWIMFTVAWLITIGGLWVWSWRIELPKLWQDVTEMVSPVDYEALCAKLRAQRASGGPVDHVPALPGLEIAVRDGVAKVVAAPGRCLVVFAQDEGVDLIPVVFRIVAGDGSPVREIEDNSGNRRPFSAFGRVAAPQVERALTGDDRRGIAMSALLILAVPTVLLVIGSGLWWVAVGFKAS